MNERTQSDRLIRGLFGFSALYDGVLGLAFLVAPAAVLRWFDVPAPGHLGYLRFPACLLLLFAWMFARIAADPAGRREQIEYGVLLKLSYAGVTIAYWASSGVAWVWKPFAVCDLLMAAAFVWAWVSLGSRRVSADPAAG